MRNCETCRSCEIENVCSQNLKPENIYGKEPKTKISCRHFTCPIGMEEASKIFRDGRFRRENEAGFLGFGTPHKPLGTRFVNAKGNIFSLQDGEKYPTGQSVPSSRLIAFINSLVK